MTQTACQATGCGAQTDAPLCRHCTKQLADTLRQLPSLIDDLQTTATRQARIGDIPRPTARDDDERLADREERIIPPRLRTTADRITLPANPLPVALDAAQLHRQAVTGVADWLTRITPDPGPARPVVRTAIVIRRNRPVALRVWRGDIPIETRGAWLAAHADRFRQSEHGPEIHAKALDLKAAIDALIDRRAPDVFAGHCDATGVHIDRRTIAGPPCGMRCWHESCDRIRGGDYRLSPVTGDCGGELAAPTGATEVECPRCGTTYEIAAHRAKLADRIGDRLGSVREVAGFLRTLTVTIDGEERQLEVTVDKVDGWLRRGRITDYGASTRGRLVKVGEVRTYAEQLAARAASRKRERITS